MDHNIKFLQKLRTDIRNSGRVYISYDGVLRSHRATSVKAASIGKTNLVGVYNAQSTDSDIIDDCLWFINQYDKSKVEQGRVLDQKMDLAE
ncbi:MAG: hypothetical protein COB23_03125 [Methylophaga sp.]|nr:MAG: hypothetical protein COB23_03125 [Methylophaga sp.]